jgi:hypothetical protein
MNYILEGNINFSDSLLIMLSNENNDEDKNVCLISGEKLEDKSIKLDCGHSFNYDCLFNEIVSQRKKNRLETQKVFNTEIKCPYCRHNHKGILPWYNGYKKIKYVNWSENNVKILVKCKSILKSGKRKGEMCGCNAKYGNYCGKHKKYNET